MSVQEMLRSLIQEARDRRMWLWCNYQDIWFSPDELEAMNKKGKCLWGPVNWKLRDGQENTIKLENLVKQAEDNLKDWKKKCLVSL